jgi:hypothetical protein
MFPLHRFAAGIFEPPDILILAFHNDLILSVHSAGLSDVQGAS